MDKGASWIHDASAGHPIKELADKFNLQTTATDEENGDAVYDSDGNELPSSVWVNIQQVNIISGGFRRKRPPQTKISLIS